VLGRAQLRPLTSAPARLGCLGRTLLFIGYHAEQSQAQASSKHSPLSGTDDFPGTSVVVTLSEAYSSLSAYVGPKQEACSFPVPLPLLSPVFFFLFPPSPLTNSFCLLLSPLQYSFLGMDIQVLGCLVSKQPRLYNHSLGCLYLSQPCHELRLLLFPLPHPSL